MSDTVVVDSSAVLALLRGEPGSTQVKAVLAVAVVSAVNFGECVTKIAERGDDLERAIAQLRSLPIRILAHDAEQAEHAGRLRAATRGRGLSYGDRACLALAAALGAPALTADRAWSDLDLGVRVEVIR